MSHCYKTDAMLCCGYDIWLPCGLQTDEDDRPTHPPVITDVEVLWNPFDDIIPRSTKEQREAEAVARKCAASLSTFHATLCQ